MAEMAVITLDGDLHAYLVQHALARQGIDLAIVAADRLASAGGLTWHDDDGAAVTVPTEDGGTLDVAALRLVWWRRGRGVAEIAEAVTDPAMRTLVEQDGRAGLRGAFLTAFTGRWVSDPFATERAENKLVQLRAARHVGLRVPATLVSSDPVAVRAFIAAHGGTVVAKTLTGVLGTALEAGRVTADSLSDDEVRLAPTIYQEEVAGRHHLRVMVFGEQVHAARITSPALDWRLAGDLDVAPFAPDARLAEGLRTLIGHLGLRMGVFDVKLTPDGEPVFLEVNPQGQFLFVEGLCGLPLTDAFCRFAVDELALTAV